MPIRQLLDSNAFNPEEVTILRDVFEDTLRALKLTDRRDPVTSLIHRTRAPRGTRSCTFASSGPAGVLTCPGAFRNASDLRMARAGRDCDACARRCGISASKTKNMRASNTLFAGG